MPTPHVEVPDKSPSSWVQWFETPQVFGMLISLASFIGFACLGRSSFVRDPGVLWHTAAGREMFQAGNLLWHDPYTLRGHATTWIQMEWLTELLLFGIYRFLGFDGQFLGACVLLSWLFGWLAIRFRRSGCHPLTVLVFLAFLLAGTSFHFLVRPHILTMVLLGVLTSFLIKIDHRQATVNILWLLPLIVAAWTQIHGGVGGAVATLVMVGVIWAALFTINASTPYDNRAKLLSGSIAVLVCCGVILVNPYDSALPEIWVQISRSPVLPTFLNEHAPLTSSQWVFSVTLGWAFVYLAIVGSVPRSNWRASYLIPLLWLIAGYLRVRHASLFAITAAVVVSDVIPQSGLIRYLRHRGSTLFSDPEFKPSALGPMLFAPIVLALGLISFLVSQPKDKIGFGLVVFPAKIYPADVIPVLRRELDALGAERVVFNELNFGGFLSFSFPDARHAFDDRYELFGDEMFLLYSRMMSEEPELASQFAETNGCRLALTFTDSIIDKHFQMEPGWVRVYTGSDASLYRRKKGLPTD